MANEKDLERLLKNHHCAKGDLRYADLRYAKLYHSNLFGPHLTGADLTGADLTGADLRSGYFEKTKLTDAFVDIMPPTL